MLNIAITSGDDTSLVIRVTDGEQSSVILRGSTTELRNDAERQHLAAILAAVQAFIACQE